MITLIVIVAGVVIAKLAMKTGNDTRFKHSALKKDAPAPVEEASGGTAWGPILAAAAWIRRTCPAY